MANALAAVPRPQDVARVRPAESLGGSSSHFKAFLPNDGNRDATVAALYPEFGAYVKGGFLSHVVGKIFVRTGLDNVVLRIHRAFIDAAPADGTELSDVDLLHCHVGDWEDWLTAYRYRIEKGSYRAELSPAQPRTLGGATLHELFTLLEEEEGISGLRRFYDEVCADTPSLRDRLSGHDLLLHRPLDLAGTINKHFPTWKDCVADRDN